MMSINKRAIRNGAILALILAAIGLYQGESLITSSMVFIFAWLVMSIALWLSYKLTAPKDTNTKSKKAIKTEE